MRYNLLGQGDHWFPGENAARLDEPGSARVRSAGARLETVSRPPPGSPPDAFRGPQQRLSQKLRILRRWANTPAEIHPNTGGEEAGYWTLSSDATARM